MGPDSQHFPVCQLPAAALHRLSPGSNNPLVTVLLWLEFTCIWNSLVRQILWTDPGTIFQCCYNTPDYLHPWPSELLPGAAGPGSSQWLIKMFKLSPDFVQISIFHGQVFNIWSQCSVPWPSSWGCIVLTQVYIDLRPGAPLSRTIFMGNESNPSKAVQTIMTRSSLSWVPMSPDIKTNDKDPFQAIFFTILILIVGIQHHPAPLFDDFSNEDKKSLHKRTYMVRLALLHDEEGYTEAGWQDGRVCQAEDEEVLSGGGLCPTPH